MGRKGERELPGRNKLARNERQIASELSARSPDVIEAAMLLPPPPPLLLRLRVSLCFLPSVRLAHFLLSSLIRSIDPSSSPPSRCLSISLFLCRLFFPARSFHLRSPWTGPPGVRKETEAARQVSSLVSSFSSALFLSCAFSLPLSLRYFASLLRPLLLALRTADHLDGRLLTHQGPTSSLPTDRLCPRRENSRGVDLPPSADTCLAGVPSRRRKIDSFPSQLPRAFFCCFRAAV